MIAHVAGTLAEKKPTEVVVEAGGLGYRLAIPASSYDRLPAVGQPAKLLATYIVREDAHLLYGFATEAERTVFEGEAAPKDLRAITPAVAAVSP